MCKDCGCEDGNIRILNQINGVIQTGQGETYSNPEVHKLEKNILSENDRLADENRIYFKNKDIFTVNLISSPGTGKTALLEKTLSDLTEKMNISVLVGDQQTDNDAKRMENRGARVKQINTHASCHLDAKGVAAALPEVTNQETRLLIIENVGNLVCPAAFDLGQKKTIALLSCTEGEDKPVKYPVLFHGADLIIITKIDLAPHLDWDREKCLEYIDQVNHDAPVILLSSKTGENMDQWYSWLQKQIK